MKPLRITRRIMLSLGAACAFAMLVPTGGPANADALDEVKKRGHFVFGLEVGYKPFEYRDDNNNIVGYDIDVANEVAKRMGVEAKPMDTNWATVIQTLYDGGFDLILGGMTATEKRFKRVNFSIPYMDASVLTTCPAIPSSTEKRRPVICSPLTGSMTVSNTSSLRSTSSRRTLAASTSSTAAACSATRWHASLGAAALLTDWLALSNARSVD